MEVIGNNMVLWYKDNFRDLPWRRTSDPYLIWVSEVILQQTQVVTGIDYYNRIVGRFPTVKHLAGAHEDELLKLWQGLGYYSRARNMHFAAKQMMDIYNGVFPRTFGEISALKGIGPYTAAAVSSIAFNLPHAVVDGNVYRVLSRLFSVDTPIDTHAGKKVFRDLADKLLDKANPGLHNQALMELGALVCRPLNPQCDSCPLSAICASRQAGIQLQFPVKSRKVKLRTRFLNFLYLEREGGIYLTKRAGNDIWKSLYELPLLESLDELDDTALTEEFAGLFGKGTLLDLVSITRERHLLTHQILRLSFLEARCGAFAAAEALGWDWVPFSQVHAYAFPKPIERYLGNKQSKRTCGGEV